MKIYFSIVALVVFICFQIGWGIPFLINAKSTELFIAGVLNIIVSLPLLFFWAKKILIQLKEKAQPIIDKLNG